MTTRTASAKHRSNRPHAHELRSQRLAHQRRQRWYRRGGYLAVGVTAAVLVALAIALPRGSGHTGAGASGGPAIGAVAPNFDLVDATSGRHVTRASLAGHKTLLFFSEGVGCQACMVQAAGLQDNPALAKAGIKVVSVTTDATDLLSQAVRQYGIRSPLLSDPTATMSAAYGMLGHGGMSHPTQDGHAFMLLDEQGHVVWHQAYSPMYVEPSQLLSDMGLHS